MPPDMDVADDELPVETINISLLLDGKEEIVGLSCAIPGYDGNDQDIGMFEYSRKTEDDMRLDTFSMQMRYEGSDISALVENFSDSSMQNAPKGSFKVSVDSTSPGELSKIVLSYDYNRGISAERETYASVVAFYTSDKGEEMSFAIDINSDSGKAGDYVANDCSIGLAYMGLRLGALKVSTNAVDFERPDFTDFASIDISSLSEEALSELDAVIMGGLLEIMSVSGLGELLPMDLLLN
jgi:hypothetical protein